MKFKRISEHSFFVWIFNKSLQVRSRFINHSQQTQEINVFNLIVLKYYLY